MQDVTVFIIDYISAMEKSINNKRINILKNKFYLNRLRKGCEKIIKKKKGISNRDLMNFACNMTSLKSYCSQSVKSDLDMYTIELIPYNLYGYIYMHIKVTCKKTIKEAKDLFLNMDLRATIDGISGYIEKYSNNDEIVRSNIHIKDEVDVTKDNNKYLFDFLVLSMEMYISDLIDSLERRFGNGNKEEV